ncbi:hypothetical protein M378DRAFT_159961 [Amanita muscaria Koide BX008]|uniref:Uncharacterized protein n=1 Tax=Amanita muscaria (strain Koide BX008) TaxID=946122 RepID=A0A0C2XCC4_AMAMK|nr:hypothetical protein M378DRAFT_159961 [Amanita muscaria Koide BX008]
MDGNGVTGGTQGSSCSGAAWCCVLSSSFFHSRRKAKKAAVLKVLPSSMQDTSEETSFGNDLLWSVNIKHQLIKFQQASHVHQIHYFISLQRQGKLLTAKGCIRNWI